MMNNRLVEIVKNKSFLNSRWLINLYILKCKKDEQFDMGQIDLIVSECLLSLEQNCLSTEFDYYHTGLGFIHFGNRGIEFTVWHFGKWGQTSEYFCCSWYCYGRDYKKMELLDNSEPHFSQYEVELISNILPKINKIIINCESEEKFKADFSECNKI